MATKRCSKCKGVKDTSSFYRRRNRRGEMVHQGYCMTCSRASSKNKAMLTKYGISLQAYEMKREKQDGKCACCGKLPKKRALAVDHNHRTGAVRGLLCDPCNVMLGMASDDIQRLEAGIKYLQTWGT